MYIYIFNEFYNTKINKVITSYNNYDTLSLEA